MKFYKAVPVGFVKQGTGTMVPKVCTVDLNLAATEMYRLLGGDIKTQNSAVVIEVEYDGEIYPYTEDQKQLNADKLKGISRWKSKDQKRATILESCAYRVMSMTELPNRELKLS